MRVLRAARTLSILVLLVPIAACGERDAEARRLIVFNAGSLARPLKAALDSFARREGVIVEQESAGSLESARKLTELGKIPDLIALADAEVFPRYLMPTHVDSVVRFARNRMVVAFTDRSAYAAEITTQNWTEILSRPGVEVGRSDPELDPNGYRTLMVWQLAERTQGAPGLAAQLAAQAPARNLRPKEADLVGLLQAGELDYIWSYESMAKATGLRWVLLGDSVDLSRAELAAHYAQAEVSVRGAAAAAQVVFRGEPIIYAFAVPLAAPHRAMGLRFAEFLQSPEGRQILEREGLDTIDPLEPAP